MNFWCYTFWCYTLYCLLLTEHSSADVYFKRFGISKFNSIQSIFIEQTTVKRLFGIDFNLQNMYFWGIVTQNMLAKNILRCPTKTENSLQNKRIIKWRSRFSKLSVPKKAFFLKPDTKGLSYEKHPKMLIFKNLPLSDYVQFGFGSNYFYSST